MNPKQVSSFKFSSLGEILELSQFPVTTPGSLWTPEHVSDTLWLSLTASEGGSPLWTRAREMPPIRGGCSKTAFEIQKWSNGKQRKQV